jgi:hypothetical protein
MFSSSVLARGRAHLQGNDTEQKLAALLHDDAVQIISSFELNQIASLTYGMSVCDQIFEILLSILSHPLSYSPLTLQKTLVMTKHLLIYGAESVVNSAICLTRHTDYLSSNYNTVLLAQQQPGAAYWPDYGVASRQGQSRPPPQPVAVLLHDHINASRTCVNADPNVGDVHQIPLRCAGRLKPYSTTARNDKSNSADHGSVAF